MRIKLKVYAIRSNFKIEEEVSEILEKYKDLNIINVNMRGFSNNDDTRDNYLDIFYKE